ncbi:putative Ig domain-containing protein, partial [Candidatus Omnitrophota bacterium]
NLDEALRGFYAGGELQEFALPYLQESERLDFLQAAKEKIIELGRGNFEEGRDYINKLRVRFLNRKQPDVRSFGTTFYNISGKISDKNGQPIKRAVVTIQPIGGSVITDASGSYLITGIPNGTYTVIPSKEVYSFNPLSSRVTIDGGNISNLDFTVEGEDINKPDFIIHDIDNDQGVLAIAIGNVGSAQAPVDQGTLYIWIDGVLSWTYELSTLFDQSFRIPGEITVIRPQGLTGQHKILAEIDPSNVVDESNEENNTMERPFALEGEDIIEASLHVANYIEEYRKLPFEVIVDGVSYNTAEYLKAAAETIISININSTSYYNINNTPHILPTANPYVDIELDDAVYNNPLTKEEYIIFVSDVSQGLDSASVAPDKFAIKTAEIRYCETVHYLANLLRFYEFFGFLPQHQDILIACPKGLLPWDTPEGYEQYTSAINSWYQYEQINTYSRYWRYNWCSVGSYEMFKKAKDIIGNETDLFNIGSLIYNYVKGRWATAGSFRFPHTFGSAMSASEKLRYELSSSAMHSYKMVGLYRSLGLPSKEWVFYLPQEGWVNTDVHAAFGSNPDDNTKVAQRQPPRDELSPPSVDDDFIPAIKNIIATPEQETTNYSSIFVNPADVKKYGESFIVDSAVKGGISSIILTVKTTAGNLYYNSSLFPERKVEDALASLVEEAHLKGIKIYAGFSTLADYSTYKSEAWRWAQIKIGDDITQWNYPNNMICPAIGGYQDMLIQMLSEIVTQYDIDGIMLMQLDWATDGGNSACDPFRNAGSWQEELLVEYASTLIQTIKSTSPNPDIKVFLHRNPEMLYIHNAYKGIVLEPYQYNNIIDLDGIFYSYPGNNWTVPPTRPYHPQSIETVVQTLKAGTDLPIIFSFYLTDEWEYPAELYHGLSRYIKSLGIDWINFHSPVSADGEYGHAFTPSQYEKIKNIRLKSEIPNRPPVVDAKVKLRVAKGSSLVYQIEAYDLDGDTLMHAKSFFSSLPPGSTFDAITGTLTWNNVECSWPTNFYINDGRENGAVGHMLIIEVEEDRIGTIGSYYNPYFSSARYALDPENDNSMRIILIGNDFHAYLGEQVRVEGELDAIQIKYGLLLCYNVTNIIGLNKPPIFELPIVLAHLDEGVSFVLNFEATDPDPGNIVIFKVDNSPDWLKIQTFPGNPAQITLSGTPVFQGELAPRIYITACDYVSNVRRELYLEINQAPIIAPIPDQTVNAGEMLDFTVTAQNPGGLGVTQWAIEPQLPAWLSVVEKVEENVGSYIRLQGTPDYQDSGKYILTFIASEQTYNTVLEDNKDVKITVNVINRPPQFDLIGNKTVDEGQWLKFNVLATDPDGDSLTYKAYNLPKGAFFFYKYSIDFSVTRRWRIKCGRFMWKPKYNQAGEHKVTFIAEDPEGNQASEIITITVNGAPQNSPPEVYYLRNLWDRYLFWRGRDKEDGVRIQYSYRVDKGKWSKPSIGRGVTTKDLQRKLKLSPGEHIFEVKAIDKQGLESEVKSLTVNDLNRPPVIEQIPDKAMKQAEELRIVIKASDPDNDPIHFLLGPNIPGFAEKTGYEDHAEIIFKPSYDDVGVYENITVGVEDQAGLTDSTSFTLTVKGIPQNSPPEVYYLRNLWDRYLFWRGRDKEDGVRIQYSYRVDKGIWSKPSVIRGVSTRDLQRKLKLRPGEHIFEVKAIDKQGLES